MLKMKKKEKNKLSPVLMVLPLIILFVLLAIVPFVYMIYLSFYEYNLAEGGKPTFIGFGNYISIFSDEVARSSISFTALICIAVPVELFLGIAIAFFIRGIVAEKPIRSVLLLPMMIPAVVAGVAWKMLFNYEYGPINYFLSFFNIPKISWLGDYFYSRLGIILIDIWQWTPFIFLILYAGIQSIPKELSEAGKVDGASSMDIIKYIELPLLTPLIAVVLIIRLIDVLKIFDIVYMVTWGGPGYATHTLSYYIYKVGLSYGWDIGYASALSLLLLVVIVILINLLMKFLHLKESLELK